MPRLHLEQLYKVDQRQPHKVGLVQLDKMQTTRRTDLYTRE
jgi:hypothetical protein